MLITFLVIWLHLSLAVADWRPFRQWFGTYEKNYRPKWGTKCDSLLNVSKSEDSWCENASDCILANTPETQKANMAGSGILLGLAPVAMSQMAPYTGTLVILGRQRPLLGLLISAGSSGIHTEQPFTMDGGIASLSTAPSPLLLGTSNNRVNLALTSFLEYGLAFASVANVIHVSYSISQRSIISWSCPNWAWVICWSLFPIVAHMISMLAFQVTVHTMRPRRPESSEVLSTSEPKSPWSWVVTLWEREFKPCSERVMPQYFVRADRWSCLTRSVSPMIAYLHLFLGIAIFGSILYVPFGDAMLVCLRYLVSAAISRLLLMFEFDTLKARNLTTDLG